MAITVPDNMSYGGKKPNFDRDQFATLAAMNSFASDFLDEGHISYCVETKKHYKWAGTEWEEFKSAGEASQIAYSGKVVGSNVKDALDEVGTRLGKIESGTSSGGGELAENSVDTKHIKNGAVTEDKLSDEVKNKLNQTGGGGTSFSGSAEDVTYEGSLDATNVKDALDKLNEEKVDREDNAPKLTAGFANNLVGRGEATEEVIGFRPSGGDTSIEDGVARITRVKGETVVWNQLSNNRSCTPQYNITSYSITKVGNVFNVNRAELASDASLSEFLFLHTSIKFDTSNKYLFISNYSDNRLNSIGLYDGVEYFNVFDTSKGFAFFSPAKNTTSTMFQMRHNKMTSAAAESYTLCPVVYNLTQMFGAGNEPTTIEEFNARKPLGVTDDYNEGELISTNVDEIKSVGFNAWDEEWEKGAFNTSTGNNIVGGTQIRAKNKIPVIGGAAYFCEVKGATGMWTMFYDKNENIIEGLTLGSSQHGKCCEINKRIITMPNNVAYIRFYITVDYGTTYNNDICIHLAHTGYRNGEYEPYKEFRRNIPIKSIKDSEGNSLFPNGLLSAGSVYDEITSTKAIKRIGVVDMGTLSWMHTNKTFYTNPLSKAPLKTTHVVCVKYPSGRGVDKHVSITDNGRIYILDSSYTDAATFKAAMSGVMLYYELAEPIEVDLEEPINLDYEVSDFGTEEAISTEATTPLKADIIYQFNAVDRIRDNSRHTDEAATLLAAKADKATELKLSVKDNGNIVLSNANGESKEFMPATPSGDPMHYAYIAAGAEWNDTDAAITKTAPWGNSVEHLPKYWYFNGLGDITNEQMAAIYNAGKYKGTGSSYAGYNDIRTFLPAKVSGQEGLGSFNIRGMLYKCRSIEVARFTNESILTKQYGISVEQDIAFTFFDCYNLKYIQEISLSSERANVLNSFYGCRELVHVKMFNLKVNLSFEYSSKISKESICFIIQKSKPTTAITIILHPDAYARLGEDVDVLAALEAKNTELQGTGGSISLVSA